MSDEPNKEVPQMPDFSKPAQSIWDTFNANRVTEFQDPTGQVAKEMAGNTISFKERSIEDIERELTDEYLDIFQSTRNKDMSSVTFGNEDVQAVIWGDDGYFDIPENWIPHALSLDLESQKGAQDENQRMHTRWFKGKQIPEFVKLGVYVLRVLNEYKFDLSTKTITREEELIQLVTSPLYGSDTYDKSKLTVFTKDQLERELNINLGETSFENTRGARLKDIKNSESSLEPSEYEQLQAVVTAIREGKLMKVEASPEEDEEN